MRQGFTPPSPLYTNLPRRQFYANCVKMEPMSENALRVVFMGSPDFALPSLERLAAQYPVVGVVTQPDRPAGRGRTLTPPPIKLLADELGLPTIQPEKLRAPEAQEQLNAWAPDLIVVTAYGQILRQNVLDLPRFGVINVHASLLPRWRGAAPIQAALLHGDRETGVTIMKLDAGIDTGPTLARRVMVISEDDNTATLSARLAQMGADLLVECLPAYLDGHLTAVPQPEEGATYAGMIKKEEGQLDFSQSAEALALRVRAFTPWPGAFTFVEGGLLKVLRAHAAGGKGEPGQRLSAGGKPAFGTGQGLLVLDEVQPAGKKPMLGDVFLRGTRHWEN